MDIYKNKIVAIAVLSSLITGGQTLYAQRTDLAKANLKGVVFSVEETNFEPRQAFGEWIKDDRFSNSTLVYYNGLGYKAEEIIYKQDRTTADIYDEYNRKPSLTSFNKLVYKYSTDGRLTKIYGMSCEEGIRQDFIAGANDGMHQHVDTIYQYVEICDTTDFEEYLYLPNRKLKEINILTAEGKLYNKTIYRYTASGTKISKYDGNGNSISEKFVSADGRKEIKALEVTELDASHHKVRSYSRYAARNGSWNAVTTYRYNTHGDLVSETTTGKILGDHIKGLRTYKYAYDSHGNWIVRQEFSGTKMLNWTERKIMYAQSPTDCASMLKAVYDKKKEKKTKWMEQEQLRRDSTKKAKAVEDSIKQVNAVYDFVEQMPSYPGGQGALMKYISDNLQYPSDARESHVEGRVMVRFIVRKDGRVDNVEVISGVNDSSLQTEAVRVIKSMPRWIPGMQNGQAVNARVSTPVTFRLED